VPKFLSLIPVHSQDFLKGSRFGDLFFRLDSLEPLLEDGGQCVPLGILRHARPGAIAALNAPRLVDPYSIGPQFPVEFPRGVLFVQKDRCAVSTTGAFGDIDVSWLFAELDLQVTLFSLDGFYGSTWMDLNIDVPADLDQFWGNDSHRTVIGGKGLVQLGHGPADGRAFFYKVNIISGICQVQCRLHPCDAAAHNHDRPLNRFSVFSFHNLMP
jgi:hypothetical protein